MIKAFRLTPRPLLLDHGCAMEETLQRNDHKPDWMEQPANEVIAKLHEEFAELIAELNTPKSTERIQSEALDLAVMAMIIWARAGGSLAAKDRGRQYVF